MPDRVLVNMSLNLETDSVKVISGLPTEGKLTVIAKREQEATTE
jgi:hypothetical protein